MTLRLSEALKNLTDFKLLNCNVVCNIENNSSNKTNINNNTVLIFFFLVMIKIKLLFILSSSGLIFILHTY